MVMYIKIKTQELIKIHQREYGNSFIQGIFKVLEILAISAQV